MRQGKIKKKLLFTWNIGSLWALKNENMKLFTLFNVSYFCLFKSNEKAMKIKITFNWDFIVHIIAVGFGCHSLQ